MNAPIAGLRAALRILLVVCTTAPVVSILTAKEPPASLPVIEGKTDLATLLPGVPEDKVADLWQNARYGIIVSTNGEIALVYSPEGEALLSANSWYMQGQTKNAQGKIDFSYLGSGEFCNVPLSIGATREGYRIYGIKDALSDNLRWSRRIICRPNSLRIEMEFSPLKPLPEGVSPSLFGNVKILAKTTEPFATPNANPIKIATSTSRFDINYNPNFSWYKGYYIQDDTIVFSPLLNGLFEVGTTYELDYEINF